MCNSDLERQMPSLWMTPLSFFPQLCILSMVLYVMEYNNAAFSTNPKQGFVLAKENCLYPNQNQHAETHTSPPLLWRHKKYIYLQVIYWLLDTESERCILCILSKIITKNRRLHDSSRSTRVGQSTRYRRSNIVRRLWSPVLVGAAYLHVLVPLL